MDAISRFAAERRQIAAMHLLGQSTVQLQPVSIFQSIPPPHLAAQPLMSQQPIMLSTVPPPPMIDPQIQHHESMMRDRERRRDRRRRDLEEGEIEWERDRSTERYPRDYDDYNDNPYNDVDMRDRRPPPPPRSDSGNEDNESDGGYSQERRDRRRHRESRERRHRDDYDRDRDRERDRDRDRDYRSSCVDDKGPDMKWMTDVPTNTVLLRGLPAFIDEKDIRAELMMFGVPIKDVRLMKRKDTGVSRGFAFVEFQTITDAQRWMDHNQGEVRLLGEYNIKMHYSTPKTRETQDLRQLADWTCCKCGFTNFKRRDQCHKCNTTRSESERLKEGDGFDQVGTNPCNTLILRGLDALTTEENIRASLCKISALPIKNIKVMRDNLTATSRGYAFVEMSSLQESTQLLETIHKLNNPLEVDGKAVIVFYAKNTFSTVLATMSQRGGHIDYTQSTEPHTATSTASYDTQGYYDNNGQWVPYDYAAYYANYDQNASSQTDSTNAAAAVAQAAIQAAQAVKQQQKQNAEAVKKVMSRVQQHSTDTNEETEQSDTTEVSTKYPTPDVSTYTYDESSGYYYDASTGLHYDANTQYYYNSQTSQFLYWDGDQQTYLPAPTDDKTSTEIKKEEDKPKDKDKKEKVKVAKKIAKDMEKWAKSMNAQKEAIKETFKKTSGGLGGNRSSDKESAAADAGFAILEKTKVETKKVKDDKKLMPPPPAVSDGKQGGDDSLVASYGGDSESEEDEDGVVNEEKLLDWNKMACLLCKRQFPSSEALQRHRQLSDLHKKNLAARQQKASSESVGLMIQYRDRAKERREKYGAPEPPLPRHKKKAAAVASAAAAAPETFEQPTKDGLPETNVGNKLMQKMGWSQGKGLGRSNQGIVDPVEATRRQQNAGLGAKGSNTIVDLQPGDNYKTCVKKTMFARYHDIE